MADQKLLLTLYKGYEAAFLLEDSKLVQMHINLPQDYHIHDMFVGKVSRVIPSIGAAFVQFQEHEKGFLPLSEVPAGAVFHRKDTCQLKAMDELLVQVKGEPVKTKDATLTADISFQNEHFVFLPYGTGIHFSKKIVQKEKEKLAAWLDETIKNTSELPGKNSLGASDGFGIIVRTNAANCTPDALQSSFDLLFQEMKEVLCRARMRTIYSKVYSQDVFYETILSNYVLNQKTPALLITDQEHVFKWLREKDSLQVSFYEDPKLTLMNLYGLHAQIEEALSEKVWLKSGGYLIIQPTEALTVIDVNTGKGTDKKEMETWRLKVNLEAAQEIARQLCLRNISGIIIIDFINMESTQSKEALMHQMAELLKKDPIETVLVDMTPLGLMEITRKKTTSPLRDKIKLLRQLEEKQEQKNETN